MTNRVTFIDAPSSFEARGGMIEIVTLGIEVSDGKRRDRFSVNDPKCTLPCRSIPPSEVRARSDLPPMNGHSSSKGAPDVDGELELLCAIRDPTV